MESSSFWNPESTVLESGIQYPESGIHSMESGIQDCPGFPYVGRFHLLFDRLLVQTSLPSKRFRASWSRKLGREQKKKRMKGRGRGVKEPLLSSPSPFHFFCSRSNFRAITRLETLATQATSKLPWTRSPIA